MSIDDKLREALHNSGWGSEMTTTLDEAVELIKQAFADEGYVSPENAKKVQEMVNQLANIANQTAQLPTKIYIKPNKAMTKAENLMTGQEWYRRFKNEPIETMSDEDGLWVTFDSMELATKKAAGIE